MELKILTLNLHCLVETDLDKKQKLIIDKILDIDLDLIFLQEVAQTKLNHIKMGLPINTDNYGLVIQKALHDLGKEYYFYYEPIKESFGLYDEGVGILSKYPLNLVESKYISKIREYSNWKTRKVLIYNMFLKEKELYLATTHFGWSDGFEVFEEQFNLAVESLSKSELSILAGDFNIAPDKSEYKHILEKGWFDSFQDTDYFTKPTFRGDESTNYLPVRIDYIMTNKPVKLIDKEILFIEDRVSDHFGVYAFINI